MADHYTNRNDTVKKGKKDKIIMRRGRRGLYRSTIDIHFQLKNGIMKNG